MEKELADLTERLEALTSELDKARAERQRLVHELRERSQAQAQARDEVAALQTQLGEYERAEPESDEVSSTNSLADAVRELDRQLAIRITELTTARSDIERAEAQLAEGEAALRDLQEDYEQQIALLETERHHLDAARAIAVEAAQRERDEALRLAGEAGAQRGRADELDAEVARLTRELEASRGSLESERETKAAVEATLARESAARKELAEEHDRLARERDSLVAERSALALRLEQTTSELDAARSDEERLAADLRTAEATRDDHERAAQQIARERDALGSERQRLASDVEGLRKALTDAEQRAGSLDAAMQATRAELAEAGARARRLEDELAARRREQAQTLTDLTLRLADVRDDVERIAASRAWRWGHRITRMLRRMTFRKPITEGAVKRALKRLDEASMSAASAPRARSFATSPPSGPAPEDTPDDDASLRSDARTDTDAAALRELANAIRARLGDVPALEEWPRVSILILNRNGVHHLRTLFHGLTASTDYPDFEVIVVDNGSSDGSLDYLRDAELTFSLHVICNNYNASFAEGNNQAADAAGGDLLLVLNNDVEPFEPGWLRELVAAQVAHGGALGATLLHAEGREPAGAPRYAVQHRGIRFRPEGHFARGFNIGGDEPLGDWLGRTADVPGVTAACMLIDRDAFMSVGGFSSGYRYGTEDVDLGLKLLGAGHSIRCTGRSFALHHESATQEAEGRDFMRANRTVNRRLFLERWGPQLHREVALDRLDHRGFWSPSEPPHIAVTVTSNDVRDGWGDWYTAHELGDALERRGWRVSYVQRKGEEWYTLPPGLDYLLLMMDVFDLPRARSDVPAVAWIRNWTERWLEREWFDELALVLASSGTTASLIEKATGRVSPLFPIAANPERFRPCGVDPALAADYVFTGNYWGQRRAVQDALQPKPGEQLRIFGKGWAEVPELSKWAEGAVPYDDLAMVYSSAKVVVDDTAGPTLPYGAVNSRVFDALATGTPVITNCQAGVRELFDEDFPVFDSAETLRIELDRLLDDHALRESLGKRYQAKVLAEHTYDHRADELISLLRARAEALSFCIKIGPPDWAQAERWGDLHFARGVRRQLEKRGHACTIQVLNQWDDEDGLVHDVVIQLKGLSRYRPKAGQFNVMWVISHPEAVTVEECNAFDLIAVASDRFAKELRRQTQTPVIVLEQATDPDVFFPEPSDADRHELLFVGNSRMVKRRIMEDLLPTTHDLAVYGSNWGGLIDDRYLAGEFVPNADLHRLYASAAIVLNDHWDDMRDHGFISNRIYDVLASGGCLISDHVPELSAQFGDAVVTYKSAEELHRLIDELLADPQQRRARASRGREIVLQRHTFAHRIETLLEVIRTEVERQGFPIGITRSRKAAAVATG